jgi:hypothetical protein
MKTRGLFWQHPSGIFRGLPTSLSCAQCVLMGVVAAVVIAPEVLHAGLHVKRMRAERVDKR